jgi:putative NADH-flavin reductase
MKITKAQLKETLRTIMREESEYQQFFRKALDKAGKSITDMSDDEKKAFFTKIDAAWDGKGEKNEGNAFGAAVTAAKEKGEDEFKVGDKTYKVESVNKPRKLKIGKEDFSYLLKLTDKELVKKLNSIRKQYPINYQQYTDAKSKGQDTSKIEKEAESLQTLEKAVIAARDMINFESVNEANNDEKYVVIAFHEKGGGFVMTRPSSKKDAEDSARSITKSSDITQQKAVKVSDARKISGLVGKEYLKESVNEGRKSKDGWGVRLVIAIHNNVQAIVELVMDDKKDPKEVISAFANPLLNSVKGVSNHNYKPNAKPAYTLKRDLQRYGDLTNQQRLDIFKSEIKKFEKIVEALIKKPTKVGVKQLDDAWRTIWNHKYGATIGLNGEGPHADTIIEVSSHTTKESVNEEKYTVIDPRGNQKGAGPKMQAAAMAKKLGGEKTGHFVVANKNALKARRALEKFKGDFKNPKLKDMMADLFYESVNEAASRTAMEIGGLTGLNKDAIQKFVDTHNMDIEKVYQYVKKSKLTDRLNFVTAVVGTPGNSVQQKMIKMFGESINEGRAFINAAKKAKAEGKTEFEFNGKTYPVTIKD